MQDTLASLPLYFFPRGVLFSYGDYISTLYIVLVPLLSPYSTQEQLFISGGGLLPHLVKEITSNGMWCAGSLQTAFDLLGELCKGNREVRRGDERREVRRVLMS